MCAEARIFLWARMRVRICVRIRMPKRFFCAARMRAVAGARLASVPHYSNASLHSLDCASRTLTVQQKPLSVSFYVCCCVWSS